MSGNDGAVSYSWSINGSVYATSESITIPSGTAVGSIISVVVTDAEGNTGSDSVITVEETELALRDVEAGAAIRGTLPAQYNIVLAYFNTAVGDLTATDVQIRRVSDDQLFSVSKVEMSSDKKTATLTLANSDAAGAAVTGLLANVDYKLIVTTSEGTASKEFYIPATLADVTVTGIDTSKNTITVGAWTAAAPAGAGTTLTIPDELEADLNNLLGETVTVKFDKKNIVSSISKKAGETVIYSAFKEVVPASGQQYLQDQYSEEKFYVQATGTAAIPVSVEYAFDAANAGWTLYGNAGGAVTANASGFFNGDTFKYGKLILNDNGTIKAFLHLTSWSDFIMVDSTLDDYIIGVNKQEQTLKDYTLLSAGYTIDIDDIEEGDVVFYNTTYKMAEVYDDVNVGELQAVYDNAVFKFQDKDRDGSGAKYFDGTTAKTVTTDYLKALDNGGEDITVYYDRSLTPVFVLGDPDEVVTTSKEKLVLTAEGAGFMVKTDDILRLKGFDGSSTVTEEINVADLKQVKFYNANTNNDVTWKSSLGKITAKNTNGGGDHFTTADTQETLAYTGDTTAAGDKILNIEKNDAAGAASADSAFVKFDIVTLTKNDKDVVTEINIGRPFVGVAGAAGTTFDSIAGAKLPSFKAGYKTVSGATNDGAALAAATIPSSANVYIINKGPAFTKTTYGEFEGEVANAKLAKIDFYKNSSNAITDIVIDNTDGTALGEDEDGATTAEVVISDIKYLDGKVNTLSVIGAADETTFDTFGTDDSLKAEWKKGQIVKVTVLKDGETLSKIENPDGAESLATNFTGVKTTGDGGAYVYGAGPNFTEYAFTSTATITKFENNAVSRISLSDLKSLALKKAVKFSEVTVGSRTVDTIVVQSADRATSAAGVLNNVFNAAGSATNWTGNGAQTVAADMAVATAAATPQVSKELYDSAKKALAAMDLAIADYNAVSDASTNKFDANNTDANLTTVATGAVIAKTGAGDFAVYNKLKEEFDAKGSTLIVGAATIADQTFADADAFTAAQAAAKLPTSLTVVLANGSEKSITLAADGNETTTATETAGTVVATTDWTIGAPFDNSSETNTYTLRNQANGELLNGTYIIGTGVTIQAKIIFE